MPKSFLKRLLLPNIFSKKGGGEAPLLPAGPRLISSDSEISAQWLIFRAASNFPTAYVINSFADLCFTTYFKVLCSVYLLIIIGVFQDAVMTVVVLIIYQIVMFTIENVSTVIMMTTARFTETKSVEVVEGALKEVEV